MPEKMTKFAGGCLALGLACLAGLANVHAAAPYGLNARPAITSFLNNTMPPAMPSGTVGWSAVVAFTNLTFLNPLGLTAVPDTNLLCVWEREGHVYTFQNSPGTAQKTLIMDLSNYCQGWDDSGLLGLAFHPGFATNHFVYLWYNHVAPGTVQGTSTTRPPTVKANSCRLSRFTLGATNVMVPNSELVLIDQNKNTIWHDGGGMFFHPGNGFLYITSGDDEVPANGQRINQSLLGGLLRIDVDKRGGSISHAIPKQPVNGVTTNYFIPNSNPFVGQAGVLEEFYGLGLRSPHRMTHDAVSGRIFIGDVGENTREEVDVIEPGDPAGLNFQWSNIEGKQGNLTAPYTGVNKPPILDYTHSDGRAVIGGYIYRGAEFAADLGGKYIFGDNISKKVWMLNESVSPAVKVEMCTVPTGSGPNSGGDYTGIGSFGLDQNGELYICQLSSVAGHIYKLSRSVTNATGLPLPTLLSQTGIFTNTAALIPNPALIPFTVNSPLWSDGAAKQRWMALPSSSTIAFTTNGDWSFPNGTVFVKHFELPVDETNPNLRKRLETRLLVRDTNGASYGVTYKWRADNSDADLLTNYFTENITITTATGTRVQQWYYPSSQDCLNCHRPVAGHVLGPKTRQINCDFTYTNTGVTDNQLRTWTHIGLFTPAPVESAIPGFDKLTAVTNAAASLELRARSYLDANCSFCHRPGGVNALWDARFSTPLINQGIVNGAVLNTLGITDAHVITPESPASSILHARVGQLGGNQMPPLARNLVDASALSTIAEWVYSLPPNSGSLLSPWQQQDIGTVAYSGGATQLSGVFAESGSGAEVYGSVDNFHYVFQPLTGNGEIIARVTSVENTAPWAKAGVMIRESPAPGSPHAFMMVTPGFGTAFQRRLTAGGASANTTGPSATAPYWVRLARGTNIFTASASPDGSNWTVVGSVTIGMSNSVLAGLAVGAINAAALNHSTFDNVKLSGGVTNLPLKFKLSHPSPDLVHFWFDGRNGKQYILDSATSLNSWSPRATNSSEPWQFLESITSDPRRFYRVREQ